MISKTGTLLQGPERQVRATAIQTANADVMGHVPCGNGLGVWGTEMPFLSDRRTEDPQKRRTHGEPKGTRCEPDKE